MSKQITLDLRDDVFETLRCQAEASGISPAEVATAALERQFDGIRNPPYAKTEEEKQAARERFERHFGAVQSAVPRGLDNEALDADLAGEYDSNHEVH